MVALNAAATETLTLTDGSMQVGDIIKFDDNGLMLRTAADTYINVMWGQMSQATLKHLAENPKITPLVEAFIEPEVSQRPAQPEIRVNPVTRLERPANPALFAGLVGSPVGIFILLVLYLANLYAAYEVSIIRARSAAQVVGVAAVLPVAGPVIFLAMPMKVEAPPEAVHFPPPAGTDAAAAERTPEEIQIAEASWQPPVEKKPEAQVYARGKFTFNKRFIETRFPAFFGAADGDLAQKYQMEVKTMKEQLIVKKIALVTATDVTFETPTAGPVTVALPDIMEIKLNPRDP